ncbi:MAG: nucleoside deaminase [Acidobacteria bacterium]|nr:nucleoside deaminase [Acidobacteriota bacterium]
MLSPQQLMKIAIEEAKIAFEEGEVPVGAVILFSDGTYLKDRNRKQKKGFFSHAEFNVLKRGYQKRKDDLRKAVLYVTLEPCLMCIGAMLEAKISGLVYGAKEPKFGGIELLKESWKKGKYPHRFSIHSGLLEEECGDILKKFFSNKRQHKI